MNRINNLLRHLSFLLALTLGLGVSTVWPSLASAQQPPAIIVTTNAPLPLLVDGLETAKLPAPVPPGSEVCLAATLHYGSTAERWTFQGWSGPGPVGAVLPRKDASPWPAEGARGECITAAAPGVYKALYSREVLITTPSPIAALRNTRWVAYGATVNVQVPPTVTEGERVRYQFREWSDGETPFQPANIIAALKPTAVEAKWTKEYRVQLEGPEGVALPGAGWHADGASLLLQAPDVVPGPNPGERLKLAGWQSVGAPVLVVPEAPKGPTTIKVDAPYTLKASYNREFLFVARNPGGVLQRKWVKDGDEVVVETLPVIEIVPEGDRLVFKRWEGQEGLFSPKVSGVINQPLELRAAYEHQYMVTVVSPYGASGGGWQKEGNTATISVPGSAQSRLVFRRVFVGFPGYSETKTTIQVLVREPVVVTALYRTEVNLGVLALLLLLPLAAVILYFANRWVLLLVRRRTFRPRSRR